MNRTKTFLRGGALSALKIAAIAIPLLYGRDKGSEPSDTTLGSGRNLAVVAEQWFTPRVQSTGNVRLAPDARIEVGARVSGVVRELAVTQGSRVTRGQVIARLDPQEAEARVAQTTARIVELEATSQQSSEDFARLQTLVTANGATQQECWRAAQVCPFRANAQHS